MIVRRRLHNNNRSVGKIFLCLLEQYVCPIHRRFIVINLGLCKVFSGAGSLPHKSNRRVIDTSNGYAGPTNPNIDFLAKRTDGLLCSSFLNWKPRKQCLWIATGSQTLLVGGIPQAPFERMIASCGCAIFQTPLTRSIRPTPLPVLSNDASRRMALS